MLDTRDLPPHDGSTEFAASIFSTIGLIHWFSAGWHGQIFQSMQGIQRQRQFCCTQIASKLKVDILYLAAVKLIYLSRFLMIFPERTINPFYWVGASAVLVGVVLQQKESLNILWSGNTKGNQLDALRLFSNRISDIAPPKQKTWPNPWRWPESTCRFTFLRSRSVSVSELCLVRILGLENFRRQRILETAPHIVSPVLSACSPEGRMPVPTLWCMSICRVY